MRRACKATLRLPSRRLAHCARSCRKHGGQQTRCRRCARNELIVLRTRRQLLVDLCVLNPMPFTRQHAGGIVQASKQHTEALATAQEETQTAQQQRAGLDDVLTAAQDRLQQLQVLMWALDHQCRNPSRFCQ